jgi:hypothetical protein
VIELKSENYHTYVLNSPTFIGLNEILIVIYEEYGKATGVINEYNQLQVS